MVYIATYLRESPDDEWPFDHGDDPSFRSSQRLRGRVTWGVCRQNVRNKLRPGDAVVFFAADRLRDRRPARYQFVGFATVDRAVRQTDVWTDPVLNGYRRYGNLLIRPVGGGFEHFEPELPKNPHHDWLWRIADTRRFRKDNFNGREQFRPSDRIEGRPLRIAENYIVFRPEPRETLVLAKPPVVATVDASGKIETWARTPFASSLRAAVLGATSRSLRSTNEQRAHPHIRLDEPTEPMLSRLRNLCRAHGLRPREDTSSAARSAQTSRSRRGAC
jgi:hypothetical protein